MVSSSAAGDVSAGVVRRRLRLLPNEKWQIRGAAGPGARVAKLGVAHGLPVSRDTQTGDSLLLGFGGFGGFLVVLLGFEWGCPCNP